MTTFVTRETTRQLAGETLQGRLALVTGSMRAIGTAIGRSLPSQLGRLERPDEAARMVQFPCADACCLICGRGWAPNLGGEV